MFRTKKDVERHVADVLSKIDNENEKNLRGYAFARLFFQVKDYESAKKHLTRFLSVRDHHAASHKLMAQIYCATNSPENALQSYKRSLELDPQQQDIVLKICELYCQLPVDHETARYWADRAEQLFPHHDTVFRLREYLVSAEGEPDRHELENLIASDLAAQPKNVDRRIKLLRLYLDTERVKEAYDHATMIESKQLFPHSIDWYYVLSDIFEAYQEEYGHELDSQFYINYLAALDHLIFLTLAEPHAFTLENGKKSSSLNDAAAVLLTFDQLLKKAVQKDIREGSWTYFIHHMKGQLYFHMATLMMKRAKMDQGNRKEAFRFSAGLSAVCYAFKPINLLHEAWFSQMEGNSKTFTDFFQKGSLRTSFIGHVLLTLCKDDKSSWIQKIKIEVCIPQVKERIYSRILSSLFQKEKLSSSYFISDSTFEQSSLELPSEMSLNEYDLSAFKLCSNSLHHLVWLELHREHAKISSPDVIKEIFKNLQYSNKNLSRGNCESLCVLDLEAYLQATLYQSKFMIERKNTIFRNETFLSYFPDITDALCSTIQATWWKSANDLYHSSVNEKLGEYRRSLQSGLEVIRGVGNHGMEVQLVIHLAHFFAAKASALNKDLENRNERNKKKISLDNVSALYLRATHYWNIALGMLEKLMSGKQLPCPKDPMFIGTSKALSKNEIKAYQDEGQLFLAVRLMDTDKLNEAAESLSKLSSPYGSYYLALTLKKLASQEEKFSSARAALLNKAKNSLLETMDRIKFDKTHPLNKEIYLELEDVENDLAVEQSIANENSSEYADEIDSYEESPLQNSSFLYDNDKSAVHSTPRPSSKFLASKHKRSFNQQAPVQHFEPSPERLDAQIRALALNQDILKSVLEQQQALLDSNKAIVEAVKDVAEELKKKLEELKLSDVKVHPKAVKKQPIFIKGGQGDEEDFYDPNSILDYYEDAGEEYRAAGYSFDRASRLPHDPAAAAAAPINYVVPPTLPPGPPPALNHYNYQYPHAVLPTPPAAVPERAPFYHPPGQGLPFNEGQQLPQFHFHVASSAVKPPPPPTLSTSLPQVVPVMPPPPASMPPPPSLPVVHPPVPPMPAPPPNPWAKAVPHAFQIPLPPSSVIVSTNSLAPIVTQVTSSAGLPVATTSHSQLKDLLQTPATRTVSFTMPSATVAPTNLATSPSLFSGLNKTPETPKERTRYDSETATSPDIDGHDLEREVMGDFKPLIPLPAEIVVETGEESEVVLFEDRAKLYRFVDQEWKERGIGVVKILHHEDSGRVRLLMRRDQVLKVCANHYISPNMEILPMKNSDKAWTWVAQDFADEELRPEHFCIRFKTPEIAAAFKTAFEKAVNISKETENKKITSPKAVSATTTSPLSFGSKFLPKPGSWTCPTCYVSNLGEKLQCAACETKKPGSQTSIATSSVGSVTTTSAVSGFDSKFFPKPGSWTCPTCYVSNTGEKSHCAACETIKPGSQTSVATSTVGSVTTTSAVSGFDSKFFPKPGSWTCPACYVSNTGEKLQCAACETKKPGAQTSLATATVGSVTASTVSNFDSKSSQNTVPGSFKFGVPASSPSNVFSAPTSTVNTSVNMFGGFTFSSNPVIQETKTPEVKEREILVVSTKSKNGPEVSKLSTTTSSTPFPSQSPFSGFSFKSSPVVTTAVSSQSAFGSVTPFSGFSFSVTTTTPSSKTSANVPSPNLNISNLQNLVQNVTPAFVFSKPSAEKNVPASGEAKNTAAESAVSESVATSTSSDTPKSSEFVFGVKPATQPTTFTFGLSALSSKPSETIGFKPALSASSNAPAVFGGATQKLTDIPPNVNIFGGTTPKTEPPQLSSIFGGSQKSDGSQSTSVFGTQKSDPCAGLSSLFNDATKKSEPPVSVSSIFGGSSALNSGSKQGTSIFGSLNESKDVSKPISIVGGASTKSEATMFPVATTTSQSVFNFGSAAQNKGDTGPVEFRFGSPQKYEFNFSGVRPRSPNKTPKSGPKSPATPSDVEDDEENESFDADSIYFQPVIPLPPKVDVKTGEENEKTLFCKRAKLFRFCSGEWKERGIGDIKILYDEINQKVRLLMRRDQVLKVCLNHYLTDDITFEKRGDKTLQWAATDFSENEPSPELFALRFKTSEFVDEFLSAIESSLKSSEKNSTPADVNKVASTFSFKADLAPKTESLFTPGSLSSRFGTANPAVFGNTQSSTEVTASSNASGFSFQNTFSFKDPSFSSTFFKASTTSIETKESDSTNETKESSQIKDDDIQLVYEAEASPEDAALAKKYQLPPNFYLYKDKPPCPGCVGCEDYVPPAKSTAAKDNETNSSNTSNTEKSDLSKSESDLFNTTNSLTFADLASKSDSEKVTTPKKTGFEGAGTPLFANLNNSAEGDGDEDSVVQGPDIHFEPVIPLPELVAVKTGEEDETPIFVNRAKLFRFDPTKKEWKERGVGDLKILQHKEKLRFRIILRRDQVHKIACNHCISENMELTPLSTSQTALCWNALDYSDGQPEASQFAVRFKNKDLLEQFKQIFNDCKEKLKGGGGGGKGEHPTETSVNETSQQHSSPAKEVTSVKENVNVSQTTSSGSETNDDEEDDDEDCDTEFEKRVSFEIADVSDQFKKAGMGTLKVVYDDSVYGYHVYMVADDGTYLCDHIIAIQNVIRTENKSAIWAAVDLSVEPPQRRRFRATFSSKDALNEFNTIFEQGKQFALSSEIVEKSDFFMSPSGQQT